MKRNSNPDIITEQELKDSLRSLGFSEDECRQDINEALNLGLFSLVVGRGGATCYRLASYAEAAKIAKRKPKDLDKVG